MTHIKVKTSDLTGAALDWAVAKCIGFEGWIPERDWKLWRPEKYSTNWAQGGPIIERLDGFELKIWLEASARTKCEAHIHNYFGDWIMFGPTPLNAAMRCYVASKLGDEVEIPSELI